MIAVPNKKGLGRLLFGYEWTGYNIPRHMVNYDLKSLRLLLESNGFKVRSVSRTGFYPENRFFLNGLVSRMIRIVVGFANLGDELLVCCEKVR